MAGLQVRIFPLFVVALLLCLGCMKEKQSDIRDVFTVTREGRVLLFRGGPTQVTVRRCPDFSPMKETKTAEQVEAEIAARCPKANGNEKVFLTKNVRKFISEHYERSYVPDGKPIEPVLQGVVSSTEWKIKEDKERALDMRQRLNRSIAALEAQFNLLTAYFDANPDLVNAEIRARLDKYVTDLALHKAHLAGVSDEAIAAAAEVTRARMWSEGYARFLDQYLFAPMLDSNKLVRLSEANHPLHALLIQSLTALSQEEFFVLLPGHSWFLKSARFSQDGKMVVTSTNSDPVRVWNAKTGKLLKELPIKYGSDAVFSPDDQLILAASRDEHGIQSLKVFDAKTGVLLHTISPMNISHSIYAVAFSPDSKFIVTSADDKLAKIWDARTGALLKTLEGHTDEVQAASFSPDGRFVVTAGLDKTAKIWDAGSGALLHTLTSHSYIVGGVAFSPDNKFVLTGSLDKTAKLWSVETGELIKTFTSMIHQVNTVSFSPDGSRILTGRNSPKIWDVKTGKYIATLEKYGTTTTESVFSPHGRWVAAATHDKSVGIWDAKTGELLKMLYHHDGSVVDVSFSRDSKYLVSSAWDRTAKIWDMELVMAESL